jgi:hypothetical protein
MMGANWQGDRRCTVTKKFAWWPVRSNESGKLVWCRKYVNVRHSVSGPGSNAVWNNRYTEREFFIKILSEK